MWIVAVVRFVGWSRGGSARVGGAGVGPWAVMVWLVLSLVSGVASAQTTYYVRTSGNNANDGLTPATAWRNVSTAAGRVVAGDTVYVGAGTYNGRVSPSASGTSTQRIRFVADLNGARTGDAGTVTLSGGAQNALLVTRTFITFEGFALTSTGTSAVSWSGSSGVLRACVVRNANSRGVEVSGNTGLSIERCVIRNNNGAGVFASNSRLTMTNCVVRNNSADGVQGSGLTSGSAIVNCSFSTNSGSGVELQSGALVVRNSIFVSHTGAGLERTGGTLTNTYNLYDGNTGGARVGVSAGTGEISGNPTFLGSDLALATTSIARNAGGDASSYTIEDFFGLSRVEGSATDIGAYEVLSAGPPAGVVLDGLRTEWIWMTSGTWPTLPSVDFSSPRFVSVEPRVNWPSGTAAFRSEVPANRFALRMRGTITIPTGGSWEFRVGSDDGGGLAIDGADVAVFPGQRGFAYTSGTVTLTAGAHAIEVKFYEQLQSQGLVVEYRMAGSGTWLPISGVLSLSGGTALRFGNSSGSSGVSAVTAASVAGLGGGLHAFDIDYDGDEDLVVGGDSSAVLENNGGGGFGASNTADRRGQMALLDVNLDGWIDLWGPATGGSTQETLYRNDTVPGLVQFAPVTTLALVSPSGNEASAAVDADRDGRCDIAMFSANGNWIGQNTTAFGVVELDEFGPADLTGFGEGLNGLNDAGDGGFVSSADTDNDGRLDVLYHHDGGRLFLGRDDGAFEATTAPAIYTTADGEAGSAWGDYDNDGDMDVFVADPRSGVRGPLLRNEGDGTFTDVGLAAGVSDTSSQRGAAWGDYDHDGWLDLYVTSAEDGGNVLYRNLGDGTFAVETSIASVSGESLDAVFFDADVDGDLDLAVSRVGAPLILLTNGTDDDRWLRVRFIGAGDGRTNTAGVGVAVELWDEANETRLARREIGTARGYGGTTPLWAHFGGVDPTTTYTLRFVLPGGRIDKEEVVPATVTSLVGARLLTQTFTYDEVSRRRGVRVVQWDEQSPHDER